ncbi:hypothetical protein G6F62_010155 [Rhizopus arrhizus]|nr:hypothetical protein G6F23_000087 [Rhizopus arrhizus]KAG0769818.1 hypothetical protein G6F24_000757 [Rhizopus arrhizus]KAG0915338.1 hypothetical protein G6F33_003426 [Rhizopus arrhizus]KAG0957380.1 hypothetical protein G6F32_001226 [Rhizopus arrhizus]KAG1298371.1 hypothetical protein G6F66_001785 [Rhizopus arrhizus]
MRSIYSFISLFVISFLTILASATSTTGNRVLILLDSLTDVDKYTQFWDQLQERGFETVFKAADDEATSLYYFGEQIYSHIIHFATKSSNLGTHQHLNNIQLVNFVKKGGNMLIAVTPEPSDSIRALASEFNIELESEKVFDHSQFIEKDQSLIATSNIVGPASIVDKKQLKAPVLFSGTGLTVGDSPLSTAILNAESSAFTADEYQPRADTSHPVSLVGALQARNSARVTFVGSLDMFSNKLMSSAANLHSGQSNDKSGNEEFVKQLTQWTFQEKGVLKMIGYNHHKENETEQLDWYRVKDEIVYTIDIVEYKNDEWVPYKADDVQLEIIMLDPYIRTTLKQVPSTDNVGRFETHVKLPDVYGIFTLKVNYKRSGFTYLLAEDQVSIKPFRHNEYPRYLTAAYPYYSATGSMIIGFILFSTVWLATWGGNDSKKTK